jgi:hypothetical protein
MSADDIMFYTQDQLIDARNTAISQNKRIIDERMSVLYKETVKATKREINDKLMLSATTTWNNPTASECSLYFSAVVMVHDKLLPENEQLIENYAMFYKDCFSIVDKDSDFVRSNNLTRFIENSSNKMLFTFEVIVPIIGMLANAGYKVDMSSNPEQDDWGFVVTWKLT